MRQRVCIAFLRFVAFNGSVSHVARNPRWAGLPGTTGTAPSRPVRRRPAIGGISSAIASSWPYGRHPRRLVPAVAVGGGVPWRGFPQFAVRCRRRPCGVSLRTDRAVVDDRWLFLRSSSRSASPAAGAFEAVCFFDMGSRCNFVINGLAWPSRMVWRVKFILYRPLYKAKTVFDSKPTNTRQVPPSSSILEP